MPESKMTSIPPTPFDHLMQQLTGMPLWIKQVIYTHMRLELESQLSKATLETFGYEHTLQLMTPDITAIGSHELEAPSGKYDQNMLRLLHLAKLKKSVINITVHNSWSLEQAANYLFKAIQNQLVLPPKSNIITATIEYLANQSRLGEYLVKINRLSMEQLDQALRTQKYIEESMGERTGIANVLINLGYIKKEDSEGILFLKEESKKPFQGFGDSGNGGAADTMQLQGQLQQASKRIRELENINRQLQHRSS